VSAACADVSHAESDLDVDEAELGFDSQAKDLKSGKKSYEVDYKVYSPKEIQEHQDKQIEDVSAILGQPAESTAILLRHARWNKERLIENYMDRRDDVLEAVGLGVSNSSSPAVKQVKGFTCDICCEDSPNLNTFAMKCGHRFCVDCYTQYLSQKIKEEGEAARIKCPGDGCNRIVDSKSLDLLVVEELKERWALYCVL
jgi:ariadne-1